MKNLLIIITIFVAALGISAQTDQTANEGFVGYTYLSQDVKVRNLFVSDVDSHGVNLAYTRYVAGKGSKTVGLTADFGANFDRDKASLVTLMVGTTVKARNNETFQPYVRALAGVGRQNVDRRNVLDTTDVSPAFMLGTGLDLNVKSYSRYKLRLGVDYIQTGFNSTRNNGLRLSTGITF
jgi:opacity protein-like surface antigen